MLAWLDNTTPFPKVECALPEGLLAVGADLSVTRLQEAYSKGIFPWYSPPDPILWWSPDPRMVLSCNQFTASHSLRKRLRQIARTEFSTNASIQIYTDTAFEQVMQACAAPRQAQTGTWISTDIQDAYVAWHKAGQVHSVETWINGQLEGGLYGVSLGGFFFGESMFHRTRDASKLALAYLVAFLQRQGVAYIDCQQQTGHLASLGAMPMPRTEFVSLLRQALACPTPEWQPERLYQSGQYLPTLTNPPTCTPNLTTP